MDVPAIMDSVKGFLSETNWGDLLRIDTLTRTLALFLAITRKRGAVRALGIVGLCVLALVFLWGKMQVTDDGASLDCYFASFLGVTVMIPLYLLYLYVLQPGVE